MSLPVSANSGAAPPAERDRHLRFNFIVNILDGGFFGFGIGFASFVTVLPLFVSTLTDSAILIGLIPAIHVVGWQLPQLFMARRVARLPRFKPMVLQLTIQERVPYLGLAAIAWFSPRLGPQLALGLTFLMLIWQGLGGGFTATAWQSMIGKIIPPNRWGLFFGSQAAAANLLASLSAVLAGLILERLASPMDFTLCFLFTVAAMAVSWFFLAQTREVQSPPAAAEPGLAAAQISLRAILRRDAAFRWFLVVRVLYQLATMGFAFYTVYAVRIHGLSEAMAGLLTGVLTIVQTAANPLLGWLGDRWGHRTAMGIGALAAILSALAAWGAPSAAWFYLVVILAAFANVAFWTIGLAMTLEFGSEVERPAYIGLSNTLIAPSAFLAPLFGGWLADRAGYPATFMASALGGVATLLVLVFALRGRRERSSL